MPRSPDQHSGLFPHSLEVLGARAIQGRHSAMLAGRSVTMHSPALSPTAASAYLEMWLGMLWELLETVKQQDAEFDFTFLSLPKDL